MDYIFFESPQQLILLPLNKAISDASNISDIKDAIDFENKIIYVFSSLNEIVKYFQYTNECKFPRKIKKFIQSQEINSIICYKNLFPIFKDLQVETQNGNIIIKYLKDVLETPDNQTKLGVAHAVASDKISSSIGKEDYNGINLIIMIDQLSTDIKLYSARLKEIYGWYFPELERLLSTENYVICASKFGKIRSKTAEEQRNLSERFEIPLNLIKESIGSELSDFDWVALHNFSKLIFKKIRNRNKMIILLEEKMKSISPNLNELIGSEDAARFILMAGSLQNLAKMSASTVQMLGAEKALFRSLKGKTATPKYGKIYNTEIIRSTKPKFKGRMSRALATKISILARIDCFSDIKTKEYGIAIKKLCLQIKECYDNDEKPKTTDCVLSEVYSHISKERV
ncbi:Nucleolar protein 56 [Cucumispora dikerogammari]|nr:Nucleolar protein 56 [Cucumispora dikerogammari]